MPAPPQSSGPPVAPPPPPRSGMPAFPAPSGFDEPSGVLYATWGIRLGAYLIDALIFLIPLVLLYVVLHHSHALEVRVMMQQAHHKARHITLLPFLITAVLYLVYATILCGGPRGQTVGMALVKIRVVRDQTHDALGYGRAFGRALLEQVLRQLGLIVIFGALIWIVDMLFPLWDGKRQTLHDKAASTVVLRIVPGG
jgi:uncharacterized RDD family membrane protein YckC